MSELIRDLPIETAGAGGAAVEVLGVAYDSRRVGEGDLFVTWSGARRDGREFVGEALERGAVAVLTPPPAPAAPPLPWWVSDDPRRLLGPLTARLLGHPDRQLLHVGVTGTNGKSTVVALLAEILTAADRPAGRIGTLGCRFRELDLGGERTTPEGSDYFRMLGSMRDAGAEAVVAEVSSHALAQGRVEGALFDLALFTNLSRDHLDFHGDMASYFAAKRRLFEMLAEGGRAVVGLDDEFARRLAAELEDAVTFAAAGEAAVRPLRVEIDGAGTRGEIDTPRGVLAFESALVGSYNLSNLLAAVAAAEALELPHAAVASGLAACPPVEGRMERVSERGGFAVFVDYAHTPAALAAALEAARGLGTGRLISVFGCGGDRDRGKREPMGRIAGELSDLAILTSDNPRGEDPEAIVADVLPGLEGTAAEWSIEVDRRRAIRRAVERAEPGSVVLVAGKGHERTQDLGDRVVPFSDREEILAALEERLGPKKAG